MRAASGRSKVAGAGPIALALVLLAAAGLPSMSLADGVRFSRVPLAREASTPCRHVEEGDAECELIVPAQEGPEAETLEGSGERGGFDPQDLRSAYNLPETGGSGRTIAIVVAFNDPNAESDLSVYRHRYG